MFYRDKGSDPFYLTSHAAAASTMTSHGPLRNGTFIISAIITITMISSIITIITIHTIIIIIVVIIIIVFDLPRAGRNSRRFRRQVKWYNINVVYNV